VGIEAQEEGKKQRLQRKKSKRPSINFPQHINTGKGVSGKLRGEKSEKKGVSKKKENVLAGKITSAGRDQQRPKGDRKGR